MIAPEREVNGADLDAAELRLSDSLFRIHFEKAAIGMTLLSPDGRYLRANQSFCRLVGLPAEEVLRRSEGDLTHPDDPHREFRSIRARLEEGDETLQLEKRYVRPDGSPVWAHLSLSSVRGAPEDPAFFICMVQDISRHKDTEAELGRRIQELQALATIDPLTGVHNHRFMVDFLDHRLAEAKRSGRPVSVLMLDVDHFRHFNETYGHDAGDRALRVVAQCMKQVLREEDAACRYGGEEFAIILSRAPLRAAEVVAERVRERVEYAAPIVQGGETLTCSIGVATFPDHASTSVSLLKAADVALYEAKRAGRNRVCAYHPERAVIDNPFSAGLRDASLEAVQALITAIDLRDRYTGAHCQRVSRLAVELAIRIGCVEPHLETIRVGAPLLDVGKIGLPDTLLTKTGRLTPDEWELVRQHPVWSEQLVRQAKLSSEVQQLVRWHHERLDGSGYPDGVSGDAVPMAVRIVAVADVVTALRDDRPYRPAWPRERLLQHLQTLAGKQLDEEVVRAYCELYGEGDSGP